MLVGEPQFPNRIYTNGKYFKITHVIGVIQMGGIYKTTHAWTYTVTNHSIRI
jgi:hypothetical protein